VTSKLGSPKTSLSLPFTPRSAGRTFPRYLLRFFLGPYTGAHIPTCRARLSYPHPSVKHPFPPCLLRGSPEACPIVWPPLLFFCERLPFFFSRFRVFPFTCSAGDNTHCCFPCPHFLRDPFPKEYFVPIPPFPVPLSPQIHCFLAPQLRAVAVVGCKTT